MLTTPYPQNFETRTTGDRRDAYAHESHTQQWKQQPCVSDWASMIKARRCNIKSKGRYSCCDAVVYVARTPQQSESHQDTFPQHRPHLFFISDGECDEEQSIKINNPAGTHKKDIQRPQSMDFSTFGGE
uniref:Uncharacterized protein n=1 Tax=Grammatophora oceanica TaxID=210454 RepID=A0A7S1Y337_9STRA|mmetsp:Transcript_20215/g.29997  ORF Transcript_20215/g.29997 Transcript_20215/m.29997 type:complete len:129 (+) Transcript_20215:367-753(+)